MLQKNSPVSITYKRKRPIFIIPYLLLAALFSTILLCGSSCKKLKLLTGDKAALEQFFAENVIDQNFVVDFATDSSTDITSQYTGYNFVLSKTTSYYNGVLTGKKDGITYTGTWSTNSDYSQLVIDLTSSNIPASFAFLNRTWRFTQKVPPLLKLAPWGSTEPKVLYMRRL